MNTYALSITSREQRASWVSIREQVRQRITEKRRALRALKCVDPLDRNPRKIARAKRTLRTWKVDILAKVEQVLAWGRRLVSAPRRAVAVARQVGREVSTGGPSSSPSPGDDDDGDPDQPEPPSPARALWRCGRPSDSLPSRLTLLDPNNLAGVLASASNAVASFDMGWTR